MASDARLNAVEVAGAALLEAQGCLTCSLLQTSMPSCEQVESVVNGTSGCRLLVVGRGA